MSLLKVLSVASAFVNVAQAYSAEEVGYAVDIIKDLPEDLASPFCSSYAVGSGETVTATYTSAEYTTTTTLGCDEIPVCPKTSNLVALLTKDRTEWLSWVWQTA